MRVREAATALLEWLHAHDAPRWRHRLLCPRILCLCFDITLGWGPIATDWPRPERMGRVLQWFYDWYWQGKCPECDGEGVLHAVWVRGMAEGETKEMTCWWCGGSGRDKVQEGAARG